MAQLPTRRDFMATSATALGGGWLWLQLPALATLSACARDAALEGAPLGTLDPLEGRTMRAVAARILPSEEGSPGAEEAGAVYFADAVVGGPMAQLREPLGAALADVERRAQEGAGGAFADLEPAHQDEVLRAMEAENDLFGLLHFLSVAAVFAEAHHGGAGNDGGFRLVGMERRGFWQPPFGHYDAEYTANGERA